MNRSGQMELYIKVNGKKIKPQERANFFMLMGIFMMVFNFSNKSLGEWLDDKANGYGVYTHVNGAKYEGYWKDDL